MRLLGLDIGEKRIGVAVSDPGGSLARSLRVIERGAKERDLEVIGQLVRDLDVARIVVGYPRNMDGTVGEQAKRVERYARELEQVVHVPVILWDERLSTVAAERLMREAGLRGEKKRERVDAVAAAVILQDYLDSRQFAGEKGAEGSSL